MEFTAVADRRRSNTGGLREWLLLISLFMTLGFAVFIVSALAGFRAADALLRPNPFAVYEALWPGQPLASVAAFAQNTGSDQMRCLSGKPLQREYAGLTIDVPGFPPGAVDGAVRCRMKTDDGVFHDAAILITDDRVSVLQLFSDALPQDSLLLYWGMPDSVSWSGVNQSIHLSWDHSEYSAAVVVSESGNIVKRMTLTAHN